MDGYSISFWKDRNKNGAGVMIINRDDIPSKEIKVDFVTPDIECIELNLRKTKLACNRLLSPAISKK